MSVYVSVYLSLSLSLSLSLPLPLPLSPSLPGHKNSILVLVLSGPGSWSWPGPGQGLARAVRLLARRLVAAPPGLDTLVPVAEPLVPLGPSVVAVLPEHTSGASPGSQPSSCDRSLSSCPIRLVGSPVPDPLAVFGVTGRMHSRVASVNRKASIPQK